MATKIEVNKQSVLELLTSGGVQPFIIPEYQRPYAWTDDQIITLFDDLWEFTVSFVNKAEDAVTTYFLGSLVSYVNNNNQQEIIDGQQRITSLFLLLRAIYAKLKATDAHTKEGDNFIRKIEPAIWLTDRKTGDVIDYSKIHLHSNVISDGGNKILQNILETGVADEKATDNYSKNYRLFQKLFEKAASDSPLMIYDFIDCVLNQAILLPVVADSQDTALTIFSTLNNRGLPLSDADIFKAKIYNSKSNSEKKEFIERWQELTENAESADETIQQLFYYYMFYIRALEGDDSSTTPGIRKFFQADKSKRLLVTDILDKLDTILRLRTVINVPDYIIEDEPWSKNIEIRKILDILSYYTNEFWKYPVNIFYLCHKDNPEFEKRFLLFLRRFAEVLITKYLETPTINAVKADIVKLNVKITKSISPEMNFTPVPEDVLRNKLERPHKNIIRMVLLLPTYQLQNALLVGRWEMEHIFPQSWKPGYFPDVADEVVRERIEHLGNFIPFEKRLNIKASNGFFATKKELYKKSKITIAKALGDSDINDWNLDKIALRDIELIDNIVALLKTWSIDYEKSLSQTSDKSNISDEEMEKLKSLKDSGLLDKLLNGEIKL